MKDADTGDVHLTSNNEKTATIGLLGIAVFSICWICAIISNGTWVFGENMVSDLGVSDTNAQYFFNYGCAAAGMIIYIYGILTAYFNRLMLDRVSYVLIALAGMFLIGVGTFTEDLGWPHNLCAYSLFIAVAISAIIRLVLDLLHKDAISAAVTAVLIAAVVIIAITQTFPFLEAFAIIVILVWIALVCLKTIFNNDGYGTLNASSS